MPGTGTVPDVTTAAPTTHYLTFSLIDASGDKYAETIETQLEPTPAEIEAFKLQYQLATQASIYKVTLQQVWEGEMDSSNAVADDQRASIADGINLLFRDTAARKSYTGRVIAPDPTTMQGNQDIPLLGNAPMSDVILQYLALLDTYNHVSGQYTERRERKNNPVITT